MSELGKNTLSEVYKSLERKEHISLDDVLNKVTQETMELLEVIELGNKTEIYNEAGDVLVNIVSMAHELGFDLDEIPKTQTGERVNILALVGKWNESVQAMRGKYSRTEGNPKETESLTKDFIKTVLNYTKPEASIADIIQTNIEKLMEREGLYKPDLNMKDYIAEYPDFPKKGINFKDISPILANPEALRYVCHEMAEQCRGADKIVALDARGFIFAPMIAQILGKPWIMARKPGKLPGETIGISFDLEYGSNTIELQKGALSSGEKIALVDDLLASGGTAMATIKLIEQLGGVVVHAAFVIGLDDEFLSNQPERKNLNAYPHSAVVTYLDS